MQSPLPQFTTILLLVHLALGCCLHHSHACELGDCDFAAAQVDGCENHSHAPVALGATGAGKEYAESRAGIEHEGNHSHECSGGDCTFIADRPRLVSPLAGGSPIASLAVATLAQAVAVSRNALLASGTSLELARTALPRTHLTLQVWQL